MTQPPPERARRLFNMADGIIEESRRHLARAGITDGRIGVTATWKAKFFRECATDILNLELHRQVLASLDYSIGVWTETAVHVDDAGSDCELCPDWVGGLWSNECAALNTWRLALLRDEGGHGVSLVRYLDPEPAIDQEPID